MAQQYDNELRGIISKNDRKEKDTHPDIKGNCQVDGREYWISGWRKERKDGNGFFYSLSFEPKDEQPRKAAPKARTPGEDDGDLPFADPYKGRKSYVV